MAAAGGPQDAVGVDGRFPGSLDLVPSGDELLTAVRDLLCVADEMGLLVDNLPSWRRRLGARNDLRTAGCKDLAIDPYGNVHACVITAGDPAFVAGSLRERPLEEVWRTSGSLRLLPAATESAAQTATGPGDQVALPAGVACGAACDAGGGQSSAGEADYSLFDCI